MARRLKHDNKELIEPVQIKNVGRVKKDDFRKNLAQKISFYMHIRCMFCIVQPYYQGVTKLGNHPRIRKIAL